MPDVRPDIRPDRTSGSDPDPADFQPDEPDFSGIFLNILTPFLYNLLGFQAWFLIRRQYPQLHPCCHEVMLGFEVLVNYGVKASQESETSVVKTFASFYAGFQWHFMSTFQKYMVCWGKTGG